MQICKNRPDINSMDTGQGYHRSLATGGLGRGLPLLPPVGALKISQIAHLW